MSTNLRNIAIVAHVDHGKTTLVDQLLRQSGTLARGSEGRERILDSNDLERERGITILSSSKELDSGVRNGRKLENPPQLQYCTTVSSLPVIL